MSKPIVLGGYFKRGSTWTIGLTRKAPDGTPIDLTGLETRAMFREGSVDGAVIVTLTDSEGITIDEPETGFISFTISAIQSALFAAGAKVYFDVEQTNSLGEVWQSQTYTFSVVQEVTRDG